MVTFYDFIQVEFVFQKILALHNILKLFSFSSVYKTLTEKYMAKNVEFSYTLFNLEFLRKRIIS